MYGRAIVYKWSATPQLARGANQRAFNISDSIVHISRNHFSMPSPLS